MTDDEASAQSALVPVPLEVRLVEPAVSRRMARQARRDTTPELLLRRELHRLGLRFRVDQPIQGLARRRTDVSLTRVRIAVFVDGCFWHSCPLHASRPATNREWWAAKLERNFARDRETDAHLRALGWLVLRFWEHEDMAEAAAVVHESWAARGGRRSGREPSSDVSPHA